jgi:hypothetical protein
MMGFVPEPSSHTLREAGIPPLTFGPEHASPSGFGRNYMNNLMLTLSGPDLDRLRILVTALGTDIAQARNPAPTPEGRPSGTALDTNWSALVKLLDLGNKPEMRDCPKCGRQGMSEATRCGYCWSALPAMPKKSAAQGQESPSGG